MCTYLLPSVNTLPAELNNYLYCLGLFFLPGHSEQVTEGKGTRGVPDDGEKSERAHGSTRPGPRRGLSPDGNLIVTLGSPCIDVLNRWQ